MKNHLLNSKSLYVVTLILFTSLASTLAQTPISNGSFENWEDVSVAFIPDMWEVEKGHETADLVNAQIQEATDGSYSLKLSTVADPDPEYLEPLMGYAVLGEVGEGGPTGGIPFTEQVDELRFDVKHNASGSDAASVMVIIYNAAGSIIGQQTKLLTGVQNSWTTETLSLSYLGVPAEIMIGFTSSDFLVPENVEIGSWIQIDNVKLFYLGTEASTSLPNFSFENWSDLTIYDPVAWSSTNMELSGNEVSNTTRSTDAFAGTYAARLENLDMGSYIMTGSLSYGELPWSGTTTYPDKPEFLVGAYNYTPADLDIGRIHVSFADAGFNILGNGSFDFGATNGYETFVLPVNYWSEFTTDHVALGISAGGDIPVAGSVLLVDDFQLVNGYDVEIIVKDNSPEPLLIENATINIETYKAGDGLPFTTDQNGRNLLRLPNGIYNLIVTATGYADYNGTITVDNAAISKDVVMSVPTAIENTHEESIVVFPNPASDEISIQAWQQLRRIKIINMNGVVVMDKQTNGQKSKINISGIPSGQYVIQLETNKATTSQSILVVK